LQITEPLAQKIITLRDSLSGGFKDLQDLTQLPEITNLEWQEWKEERIIIIVK
jgi:DNA uptake protein ComE-like DNA-binding protein